MKPVILYALIEILHASIETQFLVECIIFRIIISFLMLKLIIALRVRFIGRPCHC